MSKKVSIKRQSYHLIDDTSLDSDEPDPNAQTEMVSTALLDNPEILDIFLENNPKILKKIVSGYQDDQKHTSVKKERPESVPSQLQISQVFPQAPPAPKPAEKGNIYHQFLTETITQKPMKERKTKQELMNMNQTDMFMELIRDIANELDVNTLCHKIMINVTILTSCDRGSLFLARGAKESRYLISKLFDVTETSNLEDVLQTEEKHITIPFGQGIVGSVASSKQPINIKNAYEDARFNKAIDLKTGYRTKAILCMPILDYENEVMGVAMIINKADGDEIFTSADEEIFRNYLTFCGIGLTNAQMFEISVSESKQNQLLLSLAKGIFSEPTSLEKLVQRIMIDAQSLVRCFKCCVYLINNIAHDPEIIRAFEMNSMYPSSIILPSKEEIIKSASAEVALDVARIGVIENQAIINEMVDYDGFRIKSVLSVPIFDGERNVIGVVQMMNKEDGKTFTDNDVNTVETFSIFCGLGMHNCQMYEDILKLVAKQQIVLDTLAYHLNPTKQTIHHFQQLVSTGMDDRRLLSIHFNTLNTEEDGLMRQASLLLGGLLHRDQSSQLHYLLYMFKLSHRRNSFHNWQHSVSTLQALCLMLGRSEYMSGLLDELDVAALALASLTHSLDYRLANDQINIVNGPLHQLHRVCGIQHHSFEQLRLIVFLNGYKFIKELGLDYARLMSYIEALIVSTDDDVQLKKIQTMSVLAAEGVRNWNETGRKDALRCIFFAAAYMNSEFKEWSTQRKLEHKVIESHSGSDAACFDDLLAVFENKKMLELIEFEIDYLDKHCLPTFQLLSKLNPAFGVYLESLQNNRQLWSQEQASLQTETSEVSAGLKMLNVLGGGGEEGGGHAVVNVVADTKPSRQQEVVGKTSKQDQAKFHYQESSVITDFLGTTHLLSEPPVFKSHHSTMDSFHLKRRFNERLSTSSKCILS